MKLSDLTAALPELRLEAGDPETGVRDIEFDSRAVEAGTLFVALTGARADGHRFVAAAQAAGAAAVLVERDRADVIAASLSIPVLSAPNTRAVLPKISARFFGEPSRALGIIGITGTNGKTSVSFMLESVLRAARVDVGVVGTINYRWRETTLPAPNTTPESLVLQRLLDAMRKDGVERVVMEVSSHGLATHRLEQTFFDVGVFTNLTQDHLDFHGSMQAYRDAKASLFLESLPASIAAGKHAVAVLNIDDPEGRRLAGLLEGSEVRIVRYGRAAQAQVRCVDVDASLDGQKLRVETTHAGAPESFTVETRLLGDFNVSNVLATIGAALVSGVQIEAIVQGFRELSGIPGRLQRVALDRGWPAVFVDYAHTPDALERALATLRASAPGRLTVVFGCGGDRDRAKRPMMGAIAQRLADVVVLTADNPRHESPEAIIDDIRQGMQAHTPSEALPEQRGVWIEADRREAICEVLLRARPDDVILVAGKGHETYQEIGDERRPFDDVQVILESVRDASN